MNLSGQIKGVHMQVPTAVQHGSHLATLKGPCMDESDRCQTWRLMACHGCGGACCWCCLSSSTWPAGRCVVPGVEAQCGHCQPRGLARGERRWEGRGEGRNRLACVCAAAVCRCGAEVGEAAGGVGGLFRRRTWRARSGSSASSRTPLSWDPSGETGSGAMRGLASLSVCRCV